MHTAIEMLTALQIRGWGHGSRGVMLCSVPDRHWGQMSWTSLNLCSGTQYEYTSYQLEMSIAHSFKWRLYNDQVERRSQGISSFIPVIFNRCRRPYAVIFRRQWETVIFRKTWQNLRFADGLVASMERSCFHHWYEDSYFKGKPIEKKHTEIHAMLHRVDQRIWKTFAPP